MEGNRANLLSGLYKFISSPNHYLFKVKTPLCYYHFCKATKHRAQKVQEQISLSYYAWGGVARLVSREINNLRISMAN